MKKILRSNSVMIRSFFVVVSATFLVMMAVHAWQEPGSPPPGGNVNPPLHQGDAIQTKTGGLNVMGNVGIGSTVVPIIDFVGRTFLTVKGISEGGVIELVGGGEDTDDATLGVIQFVSPNFTPLSTTKSRVAAIASRASGLTVGDRGGTLEFHTKSDGGVLTNRMNITSDGNFIFHSPAQRIMGDFSNVTHTNRLSFQTSTTNGSTSPFFIPNGSSTIASVVVANASDPTNSSYGQLRVNGSTDVSIISGILGTGTWLPIGFYTQGIQRVRIDISGNVGIGTLTPVSRLTVEASATNYYSGSSNDTISIGRRPDGTASRVSMSYDSDKAMFFQVNTSGDLDFYNQSNSHRLKILNTGDIGIGTTSPTHKLHVIGTAGLSTGTAWTNTSDRRWKDIQGELKGESLEKIKALRPISYTWNDLHSRQFGESSGLNYGFVAQEVKNVLPEMISQDDKGYYWYNPSGIEAILTAAIQEQQTIIEAQERRIEALEKRLNIEQ